MARSWEWDCAHGVGHPKPDARDRVHGCDGCCTDDRVAAVADVIIQKNHERGTELPLVRTFETGATRSQDAERDDPEGYLSPLAIDRYCEYMTKHRKQPDGTIRASDNWQLGMSMRSYIKGLWRHVLHAWTRYRGFPVRDPKAAENAEEDFCAIIFNAQGALHELVKARLSAQAKSAYNDEATGVTDPRF